MTTTQPRIVTGGDKLGIRPWYPLERHVVSDRVELLVHLATGNLVVHVRDLTIGGRCDFALNLAHTYNAHAPAGLPADAPEPSYGAHWASVLDTHLFGDTDGSQTLVDPTGWYASFTPNSDGSWTSPAGINADLVTEDDGTYTLTFHSSREVWRFDATGLLTSQECRNGQIITYTHRSDGRIESITDTRGRTTTLVYDDQARLESIVDPTGHSFGAFTHDDQARLISYEDRGGNAVYLAYDTTGNLVELIDANGATWSVAYDADGRVSELREPLPGGVETATWSYAYAASTTTVTDPNGNSSTFTFDDQNRQISATDPLGHSRGITWTANHDINTTTNPTGASVTYNYDPTTNNLIGTELPTGAASSISYANASLPYQPSTFIDPQGAQLDFDYDDRGNLLSAHNPGLDITVVAYTYNDDGSVASRTDGKGAVTTFDYNDRGELITTHPPDPRGIERYTYDEHSRLVSVTDGNGTTVGYDYDWLDRLVQITDITSGNRDVRQTTTYDRNGNTVATDSPTARVDYTYTPRGQVTSSRTTTGDVLETIGYGYDPAGNITWIEQPCAVTRYAYDDAYRCTTLTLPGGDEVTFDYDEDNRRTHARFPGGFHQIWEYDTAGRVTAMEARGNSDQFVERSTFRYQDDSGADTTLLQEVTGWSTPQLDGSPATFDYDDLGRLTRAGQYSYTFDNATNLTSTPDGTFTVNNADEFVQFNSDTLGFDRDGQLLADQTRTINEYSPTGQLTGATSPTGRVLELAYATADNTQPLEGIYTTDTGTVHDTYTHTALGLGALTRDGQRTTFIRDPSGTLIAMDRLNGERYFYYSSGQGTVHALFNTDGYYAGGHSYTPYGTTTENNTTEPAGTLNPLRWLGQFQDPHGRYHLTHRHYHPTHSRFTQPDPSGQELNPYTYANGDPINHSDPSGLIAPALIAIAGGILGRAAVGCITGVWVDLIKDAFWRQITGQAPATQSEVENLIYQGCFYGAVLGPGVTSAGRSAVRQAAQWIFSQLG